MSQDDKGLSWDSKTWKIVRTDLDLSHVFAPDDEITFTKHGDDYTVGHMSTEPGANSLQGIVLKAVDGEQPAFDAISSDYPLPLFSAEHRHRYHTISERIEVFAQKHKAGLRRLQGKIKILCHDYRYQEQEAGWDRHPSKTIEPTIHVYQFANAVSDGKVHKRLLVIYKPLEPNCVVNGNGIAIGYD